MILRVHKKFNANTKSYIHKKIKMETKKRRPKKTNKILYANVTHTKYPSVKKCLQNLGYKFTESISKNLLFWGDCEGSMDFVKNLEKWQFYNHFPGMWKIAHKVELVRNFDKMQKILPEYYNYHPKSFVIPSQLSEVKAFMSTIPKRCDRTFIIKPDKGSQGKGIFLIQDFDDLDKYFESAVAQQYISPFLVDKYKFDLRIYVLVTAVDPLRIYIHKEGMTRFCTEPYLPPNHSNLDNAFSHLTNFSLNKKNEKFSDKSKRPMSEVFKKIEESGADLKKIQDEIDDIIRFTLISNQPTLAANYRTATNDCDGKSRLFEILGFDILLDDKAHPWLIELNSMPSLATGSEFDLSLKTSVIDGTLRILDLKPNFKRICIARTRKVATQRMSGVGETLPLLFNPAHESAIAATTNWRQIYPVDNEEIMHKCEIALLKAKEVPTNIVAETNASRKRREAIIAMTQQQNQQYERPRYNLKKNAETSSDRNIQSAKAKRKNESKSPTPNETKKDKNTNNTNNLISRINNNLSKNNRNHSEAGRNSRPGTSTIRSPRNLISDNDSRPKIAQIKSNQGIIGIFEKVPQPISDSEERDRRKVLRQREIECFSLDLLSAIKNILMAPKNQYHRPNGVIKQQNPPPQAQQLKPIQSKLSQAPQPLQPIQQPQHSQLSNFPNKGNQHIISPNKNHRIQIKKLSVPQVAIKMHPNFA